MGSLQELKSLIDNIQERGIASEEDLRSKFIVPLLKWLGYPDEVRAEEFPVYSYESGGKGLKSRPKEADCILFSEGGYEFHKKSVQEDVDWVRDHSLLVVEAKRPGEIPGTLSQPEFYSVWTKTPAYILTDGIDIIGRLWNDYSSDDTLLECSIRDLYSQKALLCFSYDRLCDFKSRKLDHKEFVESVAADMYTRADAEEYAAVDHYVPRRVRRIADGMASDEVASDDSIAAGEGCCLLWDACRTNRHIILIGEAGTGKSKELQQLAHIVSTADQRWHPIVYPLKDYNGENIEDIVREATGLGYCSNSILIMDAFDEIHEQYAQVFMRCLNRYVEKNPNQHIVLSSRFNFYRCGERAGHEGPLREFKEYTLCPLSREDIVNYLQMKGIDSQSFFEEVDRKNLSDMLSIPFYLSHISHLYLDEGSLPPSENLMEHLIKHSFRWDDRKYAVAFNDDPGRANAYAVLQKTAFVMQCMMTNDLSEKEYGRILTIDEQKTLKYCSVWTRDAEGNYHFEHNNFREFLTAQVLLELSEERQLSLLTDGDRVKPSWLNTTTYLLRSDPEGAVFKWIRKNDLFIAAHMEPDKLTPQLREELFEELWNRYKEDSVIIVKNSPEAAGLARFGQTKKGISFLRSEIIKGTDECSRRNALRILQGMDEFCGFNGSLRELLKMLISDNTDESTSVEAINTLGEDSLYDPEDLRWMLKLDDVHSSLALRDCLYRYIYRHQLQDCCLDYILEGLDLLKTHRHLYDLGLVVMLEVLMNRFRSYQALHAVFDWFVRNKRNLTDIHMAHFPECMEVLLKNAEVLYREGCSDIADDLIAVHISGIFLAPVKITECTRSTLAETGLLYDAYEIILSEYADQPRFIHMLRETMDQECLQDLLHRYITAEEGAGSKSEEDCKSCITDENMRNLMYAYGAHTQEYKQISCAIEKKTGTPPPLPELTWDQKMNLDCQSYFDALFDKEVFYNKLAGFLQKYRGEKTTFKDIETHSEEIIHLASVQGDLTMWYMLKQYGKEKECSTISGSFESIDWETFAVSQMYDSLRAGRNLVVQEEQECYIHAYTDKAFSYIDIEKEITCKKDGSITCSWRLMWACFFAARFDFEYNDSLYRKLLLVPEHFFGSSQEDRGNISSYLRRHLKPEDIYKSIVDLCNSGKAIGENAVRFIRYANKQGWPDLESLADEIIKDSEYSSWGKSECVMYLLMFKAPGELLHSYLEAADEDLRTCLLSTCHIDELKDSDRVWIRNNLEQYCMESGKTKTYLGYLISLNSEYGLDEYYKLAKEKNGIPDYGGENSLPSITERIADISDLRLLDRLIQLAQLAHKEGFKDCDGFGLLSNIGRALLSLGEEQPNQVIDKLIHLQQSCSPGDSLAYYCRFYIDSIRLSDLRKRDVPLPAWEAKHIYECGHHESFV